MKCDEFREKLDAFVDGNLSEDDKELMVEHMNECEECRLLYETELFLRKKLLKITPNPPSHSKLIAKVKARKEKRRRAQQIAFRVGMAFATLLVVAVISIRTVFNTRQAISAELPPAIVAPEDGDVVLPDEANIVLFVPDPRYQVDLKIDGEKMDIQDMAQTTGNVVVTYPPDIEPGYHYAEIEFYDPHNDQKIVQSAVFYVVGDQ